MRAASIRGGPKCAPLPRRGAIRPRARRRLLLLVRLLTEHVVVGVGRLLIHPVVAVAAGLGDRERAGLGRTLSKGVKVGGGVEVHVVLDPGMQRSV